ncbi:MAG: FAD:protein FMN transferase [Acidimicrobiales bacterium]
MTDLAEPTLGGEPKRSDMPPAAGIHHVATFPALGTTAVLFVTEAGVGGQALGLLEKWIADIDSTCSRFRPDSEIMRLRDSRDRRPRQVSEVLFEALGVALRAADLTGGLVDPTVGGAMEVIGYDRDFPLIAAQDSAVTFRPVTFRAVTFRARPVPGWKAVRLDPSGRTVQIPPGVLIDLGATAKALCADRAAGAIASELGTGVLVSLGGDIAVGGPAPRGGWPVRIADDHAEPLDGAGPVVAISSGGLATSSTTVRRWQRGPTTMHHLIDPGTSLPAAEYWRTVSVAAASCLDANTASTAAVVMGARAVPWLEQRLLPSRLVGSDGAVSVVAGWPLDESVSSR